MASSLLLQMVVGVDDQATSKLDAIARKVEDSANKMKRTGGILMGWGTAAIGAMGLAAVKVGDTAREIEAFAIQTGLSSEELQKLGQATKMTGGSLQQLGTAMTRLRRSSVEATRGTDLYRVAFGKLGIEYEDGNGKARRTVDILYDIAEATKSGKLANEDLADAMTLIGIRGGRQLLPVLALGKKGMMQYMETAKGVMPEETLQAFLKFSNLILQTKIEFQSLIASALQPLLPYFTKIVDAVNAMAERFKNWSTAKKEALAKLVMLGAVALIAGGAFMYLGGVIKGLTVLSSPLVLKVLALVFAMDMAYRVGGALAVVLGKVMVIAGSLMSVLPGMHEMGANLANLGALTSVEGSEQMKNGLIGDMAKSVGITIKPEELLKGILTTMLPPKPPKEAGAPGTTPKASPGVKESQSGKNVNIQFNADVETSQQFAQAVAESTYPYVGE